MKERLDKIWGFLSILRPYLIPFRKGLDKKWWHRLANVVIYVSVVFVFIFSSIQHVSKNGLYWKHTSYKYSFEQGYSSFEGEEKDCEFNNKDLFADFLERYGRSVGTYDKLVELRQQGLTDDQIIKSGIESGEVKNIKIKHSTSFGFLKTLKNLGIILFLSLMWFVFCESIIYRTILYVIYGKRKKYKYNKNR